MTEGRGRWLRNRIIRWVTVLILACAASFYFLVLRLPSVVVAMARRGPVAEAVYATGTLEPTLRVPVKTRIAGTLTEVSVQEGDAIVRGQLLAKVSNVQTEQGLVRGNAQLSMARVQASADSPQVAVLSAQGKALRADLALARADRDRAKTLLATRTIAQAEMDRVEAKVLQLEAQVAANEAQVRNMQVELASTKKELDATVRSLKADAADTELRAPIDGTVLRKRAESGESIAPNQVVFEVADLSDLVLDVQVDEADIQRVYAQSHEKAGAEALVTFFAYEGKVFHGEVVQIFPEPDRTKRSYRARVALRDSPHGLRPGMNAETNIVIARKESALLVPSEAISEGVVWVVRSGHLTKAKVTIGVKDLGFTEVEGIQEGDAVVVSGKGDAFREGRKVKVSSMAISNSGGPSQDAATKP